MPEPSLPNADRWTPARVATGTLVVVAVVAGFALVYVFRLAISLLFAGVVLATALKPLVVRIRERGFSHPAAVAYVYSVAALLLLGVAVVIGPLLVDQSMAIFSALPDTYAQIRERSTHTGSVLVNRVASRLPEKWPWTGGQTPVEQTLGTVTQTMAYIGFGIRSLAAVLASLLLAFYWSLQEERTLRWLLLYVPQARREPTRELITAIQDKVGAFVLGQGILCVLVAAMSMVGYLIVGLPYAVLLSIAAGILEAVPYFGPALGAIPALLVALLTDPAKVPWVLGVVVVVQLSENYILLPRVMDRSVGIHPVVTLLAIAAFGTLFGIAGAVLAVPLAAIAQLLIGHWLLNREALEPAKPEGRDAISLLRYQVQELVHDIRFQVRQKEDKPTAASDRIEEAIEAIARDLDRSLSDEETRNGSEAEGQEAASTRQETTQ